MTSLDAMEDEDDAFYYEVEEIVQMHVTDSGVRMFEIKWKNYDSTHNTWEPEHNLNCPSILKEFLEKNGYSKTKGKKKEDNKKKKKEDAKKREEEEEKRQLEEEKKRKQEELEKRERDNEAREEAERKIQKRKLEKKQRKEAKRKAAAEKNDDGNNNDESEELRREAEDLQAAINLRKSEEEGVKKRKEAEKKKAEAEERRKREEEEERQREFEKRRRETEERRRLLKEAREEREVREAAEAAEAAKIVVVEDVDSLRKKTAEDIKEIKEHGKKAMEEKKHQDEILKKVMEKTKAIDLLFDGASSSNRSITRPVQNPHTSNNTAAKHTDESFTNLKRTVKTKPAPTPSIDIDRLVQAVKQPKQLQPLALSKYPTQRQQQNSRPVYSPTTYTNTNNSLHQTHSPQQPLQSLQPHHSPQLHQSPPLHQSPHQSPQSPSLPPPATPSPTITSPPTAAQPLPRNNTALVVTAPMDWQISDPRLRQSAENQHRNYVPTESATTVDPQQVQAATQLLEALQIKRQLSNSKDPRMKADNRKRLRLSNKTAFPTPFQMDTVLYNGNKFISTVTVEGKQTCYHETEIKDLITLAANNKNEIRVSYTIPLKALNTILTDRAISFMSILPKDQFVDLSKLKSLYQVNEMAGVVHHPNMRQALVLLAEVDLKKLSNLTTDTGLSSSYTQLCALFIDDLIPRPKSLYQEINYEHHSEGNPFSWNHVAEYMKFPDQLNKLKNKSIKFLVYGHSETTHILTRAIDSLPAIQQPSGHVMMFDRFNEAVFSRNLTKHKKEPSTQIWEFGVPDFSYGEMIPASEVFPNNSGGFVTTDMENVAHNPEIIETICNQIERFNAIPTVYGEWTFILPHNWLHHLKMTIKDEESGQRVREAIIAIALALSEESIQILKLWCAETEEMNSVQYLDRFAHDKYKTHQYFVYVDDIGSVPSSQYLNSIDFVQSSRIHSTFA